MQRAIFAYRSRCDWANCTYDNAVAPTATSNGKQRAPLRVICQRLVRLALLRGTLVGCVLAFGVFAMPAAAQTSGPLPSPAIQWNLIPPADADSDYVLQTAERLRTTEPLVAAALLRSRLSDRAQSALSAEDSATYQRALRRILAGSGPQRVQIERALRSIARYGVPVAWTRIAGRVAMLLAAYWPHQTPNYLVVVEAGRVTLLPRSGYLMGMPLAFTPHPSEDLDGDGNPDLILQYHSRGANCCAYVLAVSMGARLRVMQLGGMRGEGIRLVRHPHLIEPMVEFVQAGDPDWVFWSFGENGTSSWERVTPRGVRPAFGEMALPFAALDLVALPDRPVVESLLAAWRQIPPEPLQDAQLTFGAHISALSSAGHHAAVRAALHRLRTTERGLVARLGFSAREETGDGGGEDYFRSLFDEPDGALRAVPRGMENGLGAPPAGQIVDRRLLRAMAGDDAAVRALAASRSGSRLPVAPADWLVGWARIGGEARPLVWLAGCGPSDRERGLLVFRADGTLRYERRGVCVQNVWAVGNPGADESPFLFFDELRQTGESVQTVRRVLGPGSPRMAEIGFGIVHQRERFELEAGEVVELVRFDRLEVVQHAGRAAVRQLPVLETTPRAARHAEERVQSVLPEVARRFGLPAERGHIWLSVWAQSRHFESPLQPHYVSDSAFLFGRIYCDCAPQTQTTKAEADDGDAAAESDARAEPDAAFKPASDGESQADACPCTFRPLAITFPPTVLGSSVGSRPR